MMNCCNVTVSEEIPCCSLNREYVNDSLLERVRLLKNNMYMTNAVWNKKSIYIIDTDTWYSYADIDAIFNKSYIRFEK